MVDKDQQMVPLSSPKQAIIPWWHYSFWVLGGILLGVCVGHPLFKIADGLHDFFYDQVFFNPWNIFLASFSLEWWPTLLLYALTSALFGLILGWFYFRIKSKSNQLSHVYHEFEVMVAALRHHYKNLAIGIQGFSRRVKQNLDRLDTALGHCQYLDTCLGYRQHQQDFHKLMNDVVILEETSKKMNNTLDTEVKFLRALTINTPTIKTENIYAILINSIRNLLDLRFKGKTVEIDINGNPFTECQEVILFPFEPYAMEVILENILSNAMKYSDKVSIKLRDIQNKLEIYITDKGPGFDVKILQEHLYTPLTRQAPSSSHLGLEVTLHLLENFGGELWAKSEVGKGATFLIKFPKVI